MIKLSLIKVNPDNPRNISDVNIDKLKKSIQEFEKMMSLRPIIVDENNMILGGNMRYRALLELGYNEIPDEWVKRAEGLTESEKKEFIIKDNIGYGEWDLEMLSDWDSELLEDWGMDIENMDFEIEEPTAEEDNYQIPDEIKTDVKLGDLIEIGEHRLLCGDSTDGKQVERLMNGVKADMVVTDPPYNTGMKKNKDEKAWLSHMFNDSYTEKEWGEFLTNTFNNYDNNTKGECVLYVFIDWRRVSDIKKAVETIADVKNVIVWDKKVHGLGSDYKSTYENIVVGKKGKPKIQNRYELDYQDIWRVRRKMGRVKEHATQKPIEILTKPIKHASKEDDIVLDLFLGSGSTMVASHQLNRKCYGMELDPKYCQVIIDRMYKLDNTLEIKINGQKYTPKIDE